MIFGGIMRAQAALVEIPERGLENWDLGGEMLEPRSIPTKTACGLRRTMPVAIEHVNYIGGTVGPPNATITLSWQREGRLQMKTAQQKSDTGAIDAVLRAIDHIFKNEARFENIDVHSACPGTNSAAEVIVRVRLGQKTVHGQGIHADTVIAVAIAYVHALNQLYPNG